MAIGFLLKSAFWSSFKLWICLNYAFWADELLLKAADQNIDRKHAFRYN